MGDENKFGQFKTVEYNDENSEIKKNKVDYMDYSYSTVY